MNDHSRSIDIRHHAIRQDYVNGEMRIGGVATQDNTSDILTKNLQPPLHLRHTTELNITHTKQTITNCVTKLTSNHSRTRDDPYTSRNCRLPQHQQLPLSPSLHADRPPIMSAHTDDHPNALTSSSMEAPTGTIRKANLTSSKNSLIRERSTAVARTRVMVDLHENKGKERLIQTHTKCPRHSSTSSSHSTRYPTTTALCHPGAVTKQHTQSTRKLTRNTASGKVKPYKSGIEPDKRPKPTPSQQARLPNPPDGSLTAHIQTTVQLSQHHPWASPSQHINTSVRDKRGR
jgi:hypothetical protein